MESRILLVHACSVGEAGSVQASGLLALAVVLAASASLGAIVPVQVDAPAVVAQALDHSAGAPGDLAARWLLTEWTAAESGVDFIHRSGAAGTAKRFMIECVGTGLGLVDVDDDGDLDLYLVQGGTVTEGGVVGTGAASRDALYLNSGSARFTDAGAAAGQLGNGFGFGVAAGDVDDDGDEDLLVTNLGPNELLLNAGAQGNTGRFRRPPDAGGLAGGVHDWSTGAAFGDLDRDGDLDAYVSNYLAHDLDHPLLSGAPCRWLGCEVPCGPRGLTAQGDRLFLNDGTGRFLDVTARTAVGAAEASYGFQPVLTDVDDDGDLDVFVANDSVPNLFFLNRGTTADGLPDLVEQGLRSGLALSAHGKEQAGMGVSVGDVDGDGRDDIVLTNFARESNALYRNGSTREHGALFFDEAGRFGLGRASFFELGWGVCLQDFDGDGDLDLFVANGHVYPQVDGCGLSEITYAQRDQLFELEDGRFREVSDDAGPGLLPARSSRGAAAGDLDGDGDVDLAVAVLDGPPTLLRNDTPQRGEWLQLDLRPLAASVGARVWLEAGEQRAVRSVRRGSSFLCTEDRRLHFGLPAGAGPAACRVRWPDGREQRFEGLQPGRVNVLQRSNDR